MTAEVTNNRTASCMSSVLISLVDPMESNYGEHGRARSWLSPENTPALVSYTSEITIWMVDVFGHQNEPL